MKCWVILFILTMVGLSSSVIGAEGSAGAAAQGSATAPADKVWSGSFGAGLSLTSGNTDTRNFNLTFDLLVDPKTQNILKFNGLYLRGSQEERTNLDRLRLSFRDEYSLSERTFLFGEMGYLRDPFKSIDYLLNPVGGVGYKLVASPRLQMQLDGGAGSVWEKNPLGDVHTSGSLNAGESLVFTLSETATISQGVSALWKIDDFADALYHFALGIATSVTKNSELKAEFLDDFKNRTPSPTVEKNDLALVLSFVFKF